MVTAALLAAVVCVVLAALYRRHGAAAAPLPAKHAPLRYFNIVYNLFFKLLIVLILSGLWMGHIDLGKVCARKVWEVQD